MYRHSRAVLLSACLTCCSKNANVDTYSHISFASSFTRLSISPFSVFWWRQKKKKKRTLITCSLRRIKPFTTRKLSCMERYRILWISLFPVCGEGGVSTQETSCLRSPSLSLAEGWCVYKENQTEENKALLLSNSVLPHPRKISNPKGRRVHVSRAIHTAGPNTKAFIPSSSAARCELRRTKRMHKHKHQV